MRIFAFASVCLLLALTAHSAAAATTIVGGTVINQTWDAAGSPYIVQGDITIPSGAFLTIQPGTVVQLASTDGQAANTDTSRVEVIVKGTLTVNGTSGSPVSFQGAVATSGTWYGIEVDATAASASFSYTTVRDAIYGIDSAAPGTVLAAQNLTVLGNSSYGLFLSAGTSTLDSIIAVGNSTGIYLASSAAPTFTNLILRANSSYGLYDAATSGTATLSKSTLTANGTYNIYATTSSGVTLAIADTIITNATYGIYRSSGATINVTYSDVWNNTTNYVGSGISTGAGVVSTNPLFVNTTDLHLTSRSPVRFGATAGGDMGAQPYAGAATPGLYGTLWVDTELNAAGSPYAAGGDLTVAPGVTLTLDPGVTLNFANTDIMFSGTDAYHSELQVKGTLVADGTPASQINIGGTVQSSGSWYGIELMPTATNVVIDQAVIGWAQYGLAYSAAANSNTIGHSTIGSASSYGIFVSAGSPSFDAMKLAGDSTGLYVASGAAPSLTNCVIRNNSSYGIYDAATSGALSVRNCTLNANGTYNLYATTSSGVTIDIVNSIITNATYGIYRSSGATISVSYTDVWNNTTNYVGSGISTGAGMLSANPLYASPPIDLHLQMSSVCIDTGTSAGSPTTDLDGVTRPLDGDGINGAQWDLGAYELAVNAVCGDGAVEPGETCDDGANNGKYGYCNASCSAEGPRCGDGTKNGPEECDDGNTSNADACTNACLNAKCGDGFVETGVEQCDDGNTSDTDGCVGACQLAKCGDGFVQAGVEQCDDGNASNTDACLSTCVPAKCGDGFVEAGVEDCDDGNALDTDACLNTCVAASCGDGFLHAGVEQCDDGNHIGTDACTNACTTAVCGDGVVHAGVEQCDDANSSNTDACVAGCIAAACGDGYVEAGVEACDDGNSVDTDACRNDCTLPTCGDGVVQTGEACDDGNQVDTDACRNNCLAARCGDGVIETGVEQCDDGNTTDGDGCSATCTVEGGPDAAPSPDAMPASGQDAAGPMQSPGGCCESSHGGGAGSLSLALIVLVATRRPRRRRCR